MGWVVILIIILSVVAVAVMVIIIVICCVKKRRARGEHTATKLQDDTPIKSLPDSERPMGIKDT